MVDEVLFLLGSIMALLMLGVPVYCVVQGAKKINDLRLKLKSNRQKRSDLLYIKFLDLSVALPALLMVTTKLQLLNDTLNLVLLCVTIVFVGFKIVKTFFEIKKFR